MASRPPAEGQAKGCSSLFPERGLYHSERDLVSQLERSTLSPGGRGCTLPARTQGVAYGLSVCPGYWGLRPKAPAQVG